MQKWIKFTARNGSWYFGLLLLATYAQLTLPAITANADSTISISSLSASFFPNPSGTGAFTATPSTAVAFAQDFSVINFNPPVGTVPCSNAIGVDVYTRPFTNIVPQPDGSCRAVVAEGNGLEAGTGQLSNFNAVFSGSFTVSSGGPVTFNLFSDDGWILSIGPDAGGRQPQYVSGPLLNSPRSGAFTGYQVVGSFNLASSPAQSNLVVEFPTSGSFPFELDYSECCAGQLSLTLTANNAPIPAMLYPTAVGSAGPLPTPEAGNTRLSATNDENGKQSDDNDVNPRWFLLIIGGVIAAGWAVGVRDNGKPRYGSR